MAYSSLDRLLYDLRRMGMGQEDLADFEFIRGLKQEKQNRASQISQMARPDISNLYPNTFDDDLRWSMEQRNQSLGGSRTDLTNQTTPANDDFSLWRTFVTGPIMGFIEGLTTLPTSKKFQPRNTWEGISNSLGHLMGFIGVIPGVGTAASAGLRALSGAARLTGAGARAAGSITGGKRMLNIANQASKGQTMFTSAAKSKFIAGNPATSTRPFMSVPMWAADRVMKSAAFAKAGKSASKFLGTRMSGQAGKSVLRSAAHLGIASGVSNIWHGPSAIMESAIHGAVAGGLFKGIAHVPGMSGTTTLDKSLRALSGASLMTLGPGSELYRDDPDIANLVYNGLLGAYFGAKEMPWYRQKVIEKIQDEHAVNKVSPYIYSKTPQAETWLKGFGESAPKVRKELNRVTNELGSIADVPEIESRLLKILGNAGDGEKLADVAVKGMTDVQNYEFNLQKTNNSLRSFRKTADYLQEAANMEANPKRESYYLEQRRSVDKLILEAEKNRDKLRKRYEEAIKEENRAPKITSDNVSNLEEILHYVNKDPEIKKVPKEYSKAVYQYGNDLLKMRQLDPNTFELANRTITSKIRTNKFASDISKYISDNKEKMFRETPSVPEKDNVLHSEEAKFDRLQLYENNLDIPIFSEPRPIQDMMNMIGDKAGWDKPTRLEHIKTIRDHMESIVGDLRVPIISPEGVDTGRRAIPLQNKDYIWSKFSDTIKKQYSEIEGVDPKEVVKFVDFDLKRSFNTQIQEQPIRQISYDVDNKIVNTNYEFDVNLNRVRHKEPEHIMQDVIRDYNITDGSRDPILQLRSFIKAEGREFDHRGNLISSGRTANVSHVDAGLKTADHRIIVQELLKEGYYPYSGRDASEVLNFVPFNIGKGNLKQQERNNYRRALEDVYGKEQIVELDKFLEKGAKKWGVKRDIYEDMYYSNANYWAMKNTTYPTGSRPELQVADYARTMNAEKGFLGDLLSLNKRMQMVYTNMPKLDPNGNMKFKAMIAKDYASDLQKHDKKYPFKPLSDGGEHMRGDQFDSLLRAAGIPEGSAVQAWITKRTPDGLLITKSAIHRANDVYSQAMKEAGVDWIIPESSAKQNPGIKVGTDLYDGKKVSLGNGKIFEVNGREISIELKKVYDDVSKAKTHPEYLMRQKLTNFTKEHTKGNEFEEFQQYIKDFTKGTKEANDKFHDFLHLKRHDTKEAQNLLNSINIDDLSLGSINRGLRMNSPLFTNKFYTEATKKWSTKDNKRTEFKDDLTGLEYQRKQAEEIGELTVLDAMKPLADIPAARLTKHFNPFFDKVYTNYLINRVTKPRMKGSSHGVLAKFDPGIQHNLKKMGYDITKAEGREKLDKVFFLDDGWKDWTGWATKAERRELGVNTLEQAFEASKTNPFIKDKIEAAVTRVPISEYSGTQILNFGGFTGTPGGRTLVSGRVMERLAGADLDIDSGYWYMGMPRSYKEPLKRAAKQQDTMPDYINEYIRTDPELQNKDSYFSMFLPFERVKMAETVMKGRGRLIQDAQKSKVIVNNMLTEALENPNKVLIDNTSGKEFKFVAAKDGGAEFRAHAKAAIGIAVDAGKYGGTIPTSEVKAKLLNAAFPEIYVEGKKVSAKDFVDFHLESSTYQTRMNTRSALWGRLPDSNAAKIFDTLANHPQSDKSNIGMFAEMLSSSKYPDTFLSLIDVGSKDLKSTNLYNTFNNLNQFLQAARDPKNMNYGSSVKQLVETIPAVIGKRFTMIPTEGLIKKMRAAKIYNLEEKNARKLMSTEEAFPEVVRALMPEVKDISRILNSKGSNHDREVWIEKKLANINAMLSDNISDAVGFKSILKHSLSNDIPPDVSNWAAMKASEIRNNHTNFQIFLNNRNQIAREINASSGDRIDVKKIAQKVRKPDEDSPASAMNRVQAYLNHAANEGMVRREADGNNPPIYRQVGDLPKDQVGLLTRKDTGRRVEQARDELTKLFGGGKDLQDHLDFHLLTTFKLQEYNKKGDTSTSKASYENVSAENLRKYMQEYNDFFNDVQAGRTIQEAVESWGVDTARTDKIINAEKSQLSDVKNLIYVPGLGKDFADIKATGKLSARGEKVFNDFMSEFQSFRDRAGDKEWMTSDGILGMIKGHAGAARVQDIVLEDVVGFTNRMKYWRKGFGVFDWIANLNKGKEGQVRWKHWHQMAEKVADELYMRDLFTVHRKGIMEMYNPYTGESKKVWGDAWQPMNHMHRLVHHSNNALDLGAAAGERFQHILRDENKLDVLRTVETTKGSREFNEDVFQIAVRKHELTGAEANFKQVSEGIKEGRYSHNDKVRAQDQLDNAKRRYNDIIEKSPVDSELEFVYTAGKDERISLKRDDMADLMAKRLQVSMDYLYKNLMSMEGKYEANNIVYRGRDKYGARHLDVNKTWKNLLDQIIESSILKEPIRYDAIKLLAHEYNQQEYANAKIDTYMKEIKDTNLKERFDNDLRSMVTNNDIYNDIMKVSNMWKTDSAVRSDNKGAVLNSYLSTLIRLTRSSQEGRAKMARSLKPAKSPGGKGQHAAFELWKKLNNGQIQEMQMKPEQASFFTEGGLYNARRLAQIYSWERAYQLNPTRGDGISLLKSIKKYENGDYEMKGGELNFKKTPKREGYWHHTDFELAELNRHALQKIEEINNHPKLSESDKGRMIQDLQDRMRHIRALDQSPDMLLNMQEADLITKRDALKGKDADTYLREKQMSLEAASDMRAGASMGRRSELDGYSEKFDVMEKYIRSLNKGIYTKAGALLSRRTIDSFEKAQSFGENTKQWGDYLRMYARDVMGYPSMISDYVYSAKKGHKLHDPMNLKYSLYRVLSDENVLRNTGAEMRDKNGQPVKDKHGLTKYSGGGKLHRIFKKIHGVRSRVTKAERIDFKNRYGREMTKEEMDAVYRERLQNFNASDIAAISNLEAKYEVATLLAHTKSMVNNIFGGSAQTWIWTGTKHMWNARNRQEWQKINREWQTKEDIDRTLSEWGVIEEMMTNELNIRKEFTIPKYRRFAEDVIDYLRRDPSMTDKTLSRIAKDNNISDDFMQKSAWFMRASERRLRSHAFLASYMQAREQLLPVVTEFDNEMLISRGKAGVKATQFLYNAAQRPAFARTSAGKIFSRLKLWGWNSVKFRREVIQEARFNGMRENTPEFDRLKRMMLADATMIGLAGLFPYSMFDNTLPQPYQWFQSFGQWLGGATDEEKQQAFYGNLPTAIAPLQELSPAILRAPSAAFGALFNAGKLDMTANYTMWTMFPFGRIGRDIWKGMENPLLLPYKMTGIPYHMLKSLGASPVSKPFYGNYFEESKARKEAEKLLEKTNNASS